MTRYSKSLLQLTAVAAAAALTSSAFAAAAVDANAEFDTTYYSKARAPYTTANDTMNQGGRIEVNVSSKTTVGSGFVAGRGTLLLFKNGSAAGIDDAWVQGGTQSFSVKLGRFEAADMAPPGKDVLVIGSGGYNGQMFRGRKGDSTPHFAFNADFGGGVGFELGVLEENDGSNVVDDPTVPTFKKGVKLGVRPIVSFAAGPVSAKVGFEKSGLPGTKIGLAATVGFGLAGGNINVNLASQGKNAAVGETSASNSFGVNGTFGPFGAAAITGKDHFGNKGNMVFVAYSMPFFIDAATFTIAASTGKRPGALKEAGVRGRVNYSF